MARISDKIVEQAKKHYRIRAHEQAQFQLATKSILNSSGISPFEQGYYFAFNDQIFSLTSKFGNGKNGKQTVLKTAHAFCAYYVNMLGSKFSLAICNKILALYSISAYVPYVILEFEKTVSLSTLSFLDSEFEKTISLLTSLYLDLEFEKSISLLTEFSYENVITETRYMRSNTQTINGLLAYVLGLSQSTTLLYTVVGSNETVTFAVDAAIRHSNGSETSIGTKVAQAIHNKTYLSGKFEVDGTFDISPAQAMVSTDSIVIRVYGKIGSGSWNLLRTFTSEQLGASQLNAVTWTVHYAGFEVYLPKTETSIYSFYFGSSTYNSRITNFTWIP